MIVSFRHKFIFIKTRKTAGTSVEIALSAACGPDDILTLISFDDERMRLSAGRAAARNYVDDRDLENRIARAIVEGDREKFTRLSRRARKAGALYNHMPAHEIRARLAPDFWAEAYKFTVERHPYEKVVSSTFWKYRNRPGDLGEQLDERAANRREDFDLYAIDGKVVVDEILRHETLESDLKRLGDRLGISLATGLPAAKGNTRRDRRPAAEILNDRQKKIIHDRHRRTFDRLGYQP